jgi:plasmid maintenance system antidote protein VapI
MLRLGLDQRSLSRLVGVSRQAINNIANDRQPISRAMAAKLGRITGHASDYWLQSEFRTAEKPARGTRSLDILVNHQILKAVGDGIIGIEPFEPSRVRAASLDLTLDTSAIAISGENVEAPQPGSFNLKSGRSVGARTREHIELPLECVARAGATVHAAQRGIALLHQLQIEPGFKGKLQFSLFNASGRDLLLRDGDPVVSVELIILRETPSDVVAAAAMRARRRARA